VSERLAFNAGSVAVPRAASGRRAVRAPARPGATGPATVAQPVRTAAPGVRRKEPTDWAWVGLLGFTLVLLLRPQDQVPAIGVLPLADTFAGLGLAGMVIARLQRGLPIVPLGPEALGLLAFAAAMVLGFPFSFWPGGSVSVFVEVFVKVVVIALLMLHALDRPTRIDRYTFLIAMCVGYIAVRAVIDHARGVNLVEGGRIAGAVGGIFGNPNDLALNMVTFLPFAMLWAFRTGPAWQRGLAGTMALAMMATVVFTRSRGGSVGLVLMLGLLVLRTYRLKPAVAAGALVVTLAGLPLAPASFWDRMVSIVDADKDPTGSRQARIELLKEGWAVFLANPVFGVGLGQFVNYNPDARAEAWHVTHNALLEVAAELGIVGLVPFVFLIVRTGLAGRAAREALLPRAGPARPGARRRDPPLDATSDNLLATGAAVTASLAGWFACAMFASVALNWTFYFVLAVAAATRYAAIAHAARVRPAAQMVVA
jgi:putative inorganic carbon (hco3(-)) transporter